MFAPAGPNTRKRGYPPKFRRNFIPRGTNENANLSIFTYILVLEKDLCILKKIGLRVSLFALFKRGNFAWEPSAIRSGSVNI